MCLSTAGVTGCFDAPPEYSVPERLPPILDLAGADPTTSDVHGADGEPITFTVPFRTEESGETLRALFVLDLPPGEAQPNLVQSDENFTTARPQIRFDWFWTNTIKTGGCHSLTLILSYASNFTRSYLVEDPLDAAQATWFFSLGQRPNTESVCWPKGVPGVTN